MLAAGYRVAMRDIEREIASQPEVWRRAAEIASAADLPLPGRSQRVVALGCGTSWFVAQAYAARREGLGVGATDACTPTELPTGRSYDRAVLISRSGTTTEVVRIVERLAQDGVRTAAVTAVADSPVATASDDVVVLDFADERSVVQTRFATGVLALLRAHLGDDLTGAIRDATGAVGAPLPVETSGLDHFVFLGHGWTVGVAHEAALKLREAAQATTESYPAMEYRHGPVSLAGPRSLVWILGTPDATIADDVAATGATVRLAELDPMAELILIQRMAVAIAAGRGLDPDHPRHLTRSVML
jgi:fructoselysine-6-P-deglycase FrlB-like protein